MKAYPLARHFQEIAINDPGGAGHIGQGGATGFTRLSFSSPSPAAARSGLMPARRVLLATGLSPEPLLIKLFDLRSFIIG